MKIDMDVLWQIYFTRSQCSLGRKNLNNADDDRQECSVANELRYPCGGENEGDCNNGCCWVPVKERSDVPWCFYPGNSCGFSIDYVQFLVNRICLVDFV